MEKWEIFCRVIDNFGDVGVCWRLARALAAEHALDVRLWVDDWKTLSRLCPQAVEDGIKVAGVELRRWTDDFPAAEPADVVIEAFACHLPDAQLRAMAARERPPVWINLEYLSAEDWVRACHGLASPQPSMPLDKYFFFPGFVEGTGYLIREAGLLERRDHVLKTRPRADFLRAIGVNPPPHEETLVISLFSYEQTALADLLRCWRTGDRPVLLLTPEGRALAEVEQALGAKLPPDAEIALDALRIAALPFTDQDAYDELLWHCDLNLVRGEDSFVRAQWAARPMVWHIYPQKEDAHLVKLEAFMALYCAGLERSAAHALMAFWRAWNGRGNPAADVWPDFAAALPEIGIHARNWCTALSARPSLTDTLWHFCRHFAVKTR